jgi:FlaA1/EpsC-like NDP-sugar epimerase
MCVIPMEVRPKIDFYIFFNKFLSKSIIKNAVDFCSVVLSFFIASYIVSYPPQERIIADIAFISFAAVCISYVIQFHHHLWRVISLYNILDIAKYSFFVTFSYFLWGHFYGDSGEILFKFCFIFFLLSFAFLNLPRILIRIFYEKSRLLYQGERVKIILIGAGRGGELFLRETRKQKGGLYQVEGILDDDPEVWGKKIFGFKVYGPIKDLPKLSSYGDIDMVVVAIPSLSQEKLFEIKKLTEELGLRIKVLPSFDQLLTVTHFYPEDMLLKDLLGRESVDLENRACVSFIKDKVVMITGAGGSIGSEVCRQLIQLQPKLILVVDHSEYNLYQITWELENVHKYNNFIPVLANITDKKTMATVFEIHKPQVAFHAAAYKHVPLLESQVKQAVQNNFLGTKVMADLASEYKLEKFILISTDKAVNPTNVMGSTKRMAEIYCQNLNDISSTKYITVRFGNVLESAGSVIPLFKAQLKKGGPLTVTHPEITRFFMSIPEASQLVLQAGAMGQGGEIFVLHMGEPIKIAALAERLITLSGKRPYKDIDIIFTGLRPGEKLYEELFYEDEIHVQTHQKKILLAHRKESNHEAFLKNIQKLEFYLEENNNMKILETISQMVPEAQLNSLASVPTTSKCA